MNTPAYLFLVTVFAAKLLAEPPYETPPTVHAADLLPGEILNGDDYTIDPDVPTDGFMGIFQVHSKFGDFQCLGREMLYIRLSEVRALEELEKVSKTKAFLDAVKGAVEEPVKAAVKIVTRPVKTAATVPAAVAHLFKDVVGGFVGAGKSVTKVTKIGPKDKGPKPPPSREDPLGYNKLRNEWAQQLAVDPYTTNRVLAVKLNHLATIGFGTDKVTGAGISFGLGPLGPIAGYVSYLPDADKHLMTAPPPEVDKINTRKLEKLGVSQQAMKPLLQNKWFTPTLQIRFVNALERMKGAGNIASQTELAGGAQSEEEVRFLCGSEEMLARYHTVTPLRELSARANMPAAVAEDGTLVVAVPVDVLAWTEIASGFATQHEKGQHAVLCVSGPLTPLARKGFEGQGWKVSEVPSPYAP